MNKTKKFSNNSDKFHQAIQSSKRARNNYTRPRNNMGTLHRRHK